MGNIDTDKLGKAHDNTVSGDYRADPLGDGTFRMVPSGDIVDLVECSRRLQTYDLGRLQEARDHEAQP